ncbi:tRNA (guanosine(37)-N1)-methyltransferase TrmD [Candidatus Uhrbacteria bacterium]|nr:tRNA (guanosine(37)-N1)-methyltransferase TrmD [Candidatus Uhrbacteria bacterium]
MRFDLITIFPKMFDCYINESILKRAQKKKLIKINVYDLRGWATDKHKTVDDKPYGGGPGMVMKVETFYRALQALKNQKLRSKNKGTRIILTSAKGKQFTQDDARRLAKYKQVIILCGRYEGVDERVAEHLADEEISVGPYVLTGGELPAMIMVDAISRHIPGVLGKAESLEETRQAKSYKLKAISSSLEYPQYTRPEKFRKWKVPKVLLSGNHQKIEEWRRKMARK